MWCRFERQDWYGKGKAIAPKKVSLAWVVRDASESTFRKKLMREEEITRLQQESGRSKDRVTLHEAD